VYGICTSEGRIDPIFVEKRRQDLRNGSGAIHKLLLFQRHLWWARQGLNLRPHLCEGWENGFWRIYTDQKSFKNSHGRAGACAYVFHVFFMDFWRAEKCLI